MDVAFAIFGGSMIGVIVGIALISVAIKNKWS